MVELLFLLAFAGVLFFTGISIVGMALAVAVGFVVMAVAGMIGMVFKLLPWLILIAVVVWIYRDRKGERPRY
ncbi:envelope stress response protein PspG [Photobacterium aphoticum]|uniref:Phage-shock protein n=1 Tax=Photobacterium aphoticum TaxID=754436 RepID=A0A0J1GJ66_9GAMM|nr:envelope stress response protein PspG [Photobacterium aphoticum]KLU99742.1 phage-shock protein [Photobacterium aphoticum]PSU55719.1 envelope stress response protein PspG [Photobacterium aphoticum]GHA66633.1 phage shock protein G [Photobacterium aphoticum]